MTSVDVERSFSQYKHPLNDRREGLTEENTKRLMMLYFNGDVEDHIYIFVISHYSSHTILEVLKRRKNSMLERNYTKIKNGKCLNGKSPHPDNL